MTVAQRECVFLIVNVRKFEVFSEKVFSYSLLFSVLPQIKCSSD